MEETTMSIATYRVKLKRTLRKAGLPVMNDTPTERLESMVNKTRFVAKCNECDFTTHSYIIEKTAQDFAEEHAMKSGHIVDVVPVDWKKY